MKRPIDQEKLHDLIGLYGRLEKRNVAEFGKDSVQASHARKILESYRTLRDTGRLP